MRVESRDAMETKTRIITISTIAFLGVVCITSGIVMPLVITFEPQNTIKFTITQKRVAKAKTTEIKLKDMGISPFLHERNIDYDYIESKYIISEVKLSNLDIKEVPLVKFILNDVNKNGNKYVVTYDKYTIEDPYKLLDYYNSTEGEHDDTSKILSYLSGNERKQTIIDLLNKDILTNADALKEELKVDYFINDNDFIIKTVSKK